MFYIRIHILAIEPFFKSTLFNSTVAFCCFYASDYACALFCRSWRLATIPSPKEFELIIYNEKCYSLGYHSPSPCKRKEIVLQAIARATKKSH